MPVLLDYGTMVNSIICCSLKVPGDLGNHPLVTQCPFIADSDACAPGVPFIPTSRQSPDPTGPGKQIKSEMAIERVCVLIHSAMTQERGTWYFLTGQVLDPDRGFSSMREKSAAVLQNNKNRQRYFSP